MNVYNESKANFICTDHANFFTFHTTEVIKI